MRFIPRPPSFFLLVSIVAAKPFSLPELARLIEELQWSWSANRPVKGRGQRQRSVPMNRQRARQGGETDPRRPEAIRSPLFPRQRSPLGALQQFTPNLGPLDLSTVAGGLSKQRLLPLLPWGALGLALAAVDSNIAGALVMGGGLGWSVWQFQRSRTGFPRQVLTQVQRRVDGLALTAEQRRWGIAIASGGAMAVSAYGGLMLWENFQNGWLVAGVIGQSGLTVGLAVMLLTRDRQRQQSQAIERFHRLLEGLLTVSVEQRPVFVQQLLWLSMKGHLDGYQEGMVLQALQGLFMTTQDGTEKERLSQAIAQLKQFQTLHASQRSSRASYALSGSTLGSVEMPLGDVGRWAERQSEEIAPAEKPLKKHP